MGRRPSSPRVVDFEELNSKVSLPAPPKIPREASSDGAPVDLDHVLTLPPVARPESGVFNVQNNPLAPPTLAPDAADGPATRGRPLLRGALAIAVLLGSSAASYALGREHGHLNGELAATRTQISQAGSVPSARATEPEPSVASAAPVAEAVLVEEEQPILADAPPSEAEEESSEPLFRALSTRPAAPEAAPEARVQSASVAAPAEEGAGPVAPSEQSAASTLADSPSGPAEDAGPTEPAGATGELVAGAPSEASPGEGTAPSEEASEHPIDAVAPTRSLADLLGTTEAAPAAPALPERPSRSDVRTALNGVLPGVRRCAGGAGPITMSIRVAPDGHVTSSRVTEGELSTAVDRCVVTAVSAARFPAFSGRDFHISYPFRL